MLRNASLWFVLLSATATMAAAQNSLLGVQKSELIGVASLTSATLVASATDSQGSLYVLVGDSPNYAYYIAKLTPAGDRIVYQTMLPFQPSAMAVDPAGNVYMSSSDPGTGELTVEKLGTDGTTVIYQTVIGRLWTGGTIAVDSSGRAWVAGSVPAGILRTPLGAFQTTPGAFQQTPPGSGPVFVARLNPAGGIDYATYVGGSNYESLYAIAVDRSGSAFLTGYTFSPDFPATPGAYLTAFTPNSVPFLVRLSPDGPQLTWSTFISLPAAGYYLAGLALDSTGSAVMALTTITYGSPIYPGFLVTRFNPQGTAVTLSKAVGGATATALAVDGSGRIYVAEVPTVNFQARNSLTTCDSSRAALSVLDTNGNILQSTYIAGAYGMASNGLLSLSLAILPDASVDVLSSANPGTSGQPVVGSSPGILSLVRLSPNPNVQTFQLACVGNAASYDTTAIAGGEIVSLFGNGLGPAAGTQPQVDLHSGYPKQLDTVQVTFNGTPGPLLYVQDGQVNAIAPWSLQTASTVEICVVYNGAATNCLSHPVSVDAGVFTVDGYHVAAVNQDGSVNSASNPARVGSIVSIFATGTGPLSPPQADGAIVQPPLPTDTLGVSMYWNQPIGWNTGLWDRQPVSLVHVGPAPFGVAGLTRIDFVVPDNFATLPFSGWYPMVLQVQGPGPVPFASAGFLLYEAQP